MALTTLANVKAWLKENSVNADRDAVLTRLIDAASDYVETWLGRTILQDTYSYTVDGHGGAKLVVENYPVIAVSSVMVDNVPIPASVNGGFGYVFNEVRIALIGHRFARGLQNVYLSYTAGYATVPAELEQAVIELVSLRYKETDRIGLVSKGLAGETITFSQKDFSRSIQTALEQYRRVMSP